MAADLLRVLASSRLSSAAAGQALGMSKSAAHRYLAALRDASVVQMAGIGKSVKWRLADQAAVGAGILDPLALRLQAALTRLRQVPEDLGEIYELVDQFVCKGGKLPVYARWIEGSGAGQ